jgi:hypothetical protein
MSFELILPFFPDELQALLLDPSISDLMINGTTGVFADRDGVVAHIPLAKEFTNDRLQACPDRTEKGPLWRLLDVQANTGMLITESFAMWPGSSVSGLYFAHPESRYFSLGKIDRDQVVDYHERKGMSVAEVERWMGQQLNYDPSESAPTSV